jgi:hypothetical protein
LWSNWGIWRGPVTLATLLVLVPSCTFFGPDEDERARDRLEANRRKWTTAGILDYDMRMSASVAGAPFTVASDVVVQVRDGIRIIAVDPDTDALVFKAMRRPDLYPDVEGLFDTVEQSITEADELRVTYDRELGFPREIFSDPNRSSVDGEYEAIVLALTPTSQPVETLRERVTTRREQWDASGIADYDFSLGRVAPGLDPGLAFEDVRLVVRSGVVLSRTVVETGLPLDPSFDALYQPVDAIFDIIDMAIAADAHRVAVAFDLQLGYPTDVFVDPVAEIPDDREEYFVSDLTPQDGNP